MIIPSFKTRARNLPGRQRGGDLDVIVRGRIAAMIGLLSLYTDNDLSYYWKRASLVVAKTLKRGENHARRIRGSGPWAS